MSENQSPSEKTYWIRLMQTDLYGEQPAYAPNEYGKTFLEVYEGFLYPTEEAVKRDILEDWESKRDDYWHESNENNRDEDFDEYFESEEPPEDEEFYAECTVDEDGTIRTQFNELTAEHIYKAYGMEIPSNLLKPAGPSL